MITHCVHQSPRTVMPNSVPNPMSSRIAAIKSSENAYPLETANASTNDGHIGFEIAKVSARPMTIQFVIMSPTYGPREDEIAG